MNDLKFTRPSVRRAVGFIAATVVLLGMIAGLVLFANAIATHHDSHPAPGGDYVRLFILDIVFWGPMALLAIWQISMPLILGLGLAAASLRRKPAS